MKKYLNTIKPKKTASTGQHCCQLHGWLTLLYSIPGNYAVIIHSDRDCSNLIPKFNRDGLSHYDRFFCTNITDSDIILGTSIKKLEHCIEAVAQEIKPKAILVLGSCLSVLVNDDVEKAIKNIQKKLTLPVYYRKTSGFKFDTPTKILDECALFFLELTLRTQKNNKIPRTINLIGFDNFCNTFSHHNIETLGVQEIKDDLFTLAEITVNALINNATPFECWQHIIQSEFTITCDKNMYPKLSHSLKKNFNITTLEAPYPVGLQATIEFFKTILLAYDIEPKKAFAKLKKKIELVAQSIKENKKYFYKRKLFYNIASALNFTTSNSAKESLLALTFFRELGFDITILAQGSPEKDNKAHIHKILKKNGVTEPLIIFGHCGDAYTVLKNHTAAFVFGSSLLEKQTIETNNYFIHYKELKVGLTNAIKNIEHLKSFLLREKNVHS